MGGINDDGTLFEWDPVNHVFTKKLDFNGPETGSGPEGSLIQANNGKLYGMTWSGGKYDYGVLFEWDIHTDTYIKKFDFDDETGGNPVGALYQAANGKLYGATRNYAGHGIDCGLIFEWDIVTNTIEIIHEFIYTEGWLNGCSPLSTFVQADNRKSQGNIQKNMISTLLKTEVIQTW